MDARDEDVQLMLAFQGGDERAFDRLFERWAQRLLRFLDRMVGDPAVAEELVQETFLRVHRGRAGYRPEARFSTWLYTIATHAARNEMRRPFRRAPHGSLDGPADEAPAMADPAPAVDERAHASREALRMAQRLGALPERQRAALWLCAVEGLAAPRSGRARPPAGAPRALPCARARGAGGARRAALRRPQPRGTRPHPRGPAPRRAGSLRRAPPLPRYPRTAGSRARARRGGARRWGRSTRRSTRAWRTGSARSPSSSWPPRRRARGAT